jgi:hypothetical protein
VFVGENAKEANAHATREMRKPDDHRFVSCSRLALEQQSTLPTIVATPTPPSGTSQDRSNSGRMINKP